MKIAMVIPSFYPLVGGAEKQLEGLASNLIGDNLSLTVFTRAIKGLDRNETFRNIPIERLTLKLPKFDFMIALLFQLYRRRQEIDIIHCHSMNGQAAVPAMIMGRILNKPVILKVTRSGKGAVISRLGKSWFNWVYTYLLRNYVSYFIAITGDVENELLSIGINSSKIIPIPNAVQVGDLSDVKKNDVLHFICVSRLIKRKNIETLIKAINVIRDFDNIHLTIIGDGSERKKLEDLVQSLNLTELVSFLGEVDHKDVSSILRLSDIFVLPSYSEGMSNALLEAMAQGLVVVGNDIAANQALISTGKNGILCDVDSDLPSVLETLMGSKLQRQEIGYEAWKTIEEKYDFKIISKQYVELYRRVLSEI